MIFFYYWFLYKLQILVDFYRFTLSFWFFFFVIFFFKQKTAYEMRISDWSSDVCSSDLGENLVRSCRPPDRHAADGQPFSSPSDARMGLGLSGARLSARAAGDILPESGSYRSLAAFSYRHGRTQQRRPRHPAFQLHPQTRDQRWRSYPAATLERFGQWQRMRGAARHGTAGEGRRCESGFFCNAGNRPWPQHGWSCAPDC